MKKSKFSLARKDELIKACKDEQRAKTPTLAEEMKAGFLSAFTIENRGRMK